MSSLSISAVGGETGTNTDPTPELTGSAFTSAAGTPTAPRSRAVPAPAGSAKHQRPRGPSAAQRLPPHAPRLRLLPGLTRRGRQPGTRPAAPAAAPGQRGTLRAGCSLSRGRFSTQASLTGAGQREARLGQLRLCPPPGLPVSLRRAAPSPVRRRCFPAARPAAQRRLPPLRRPAGSPTWDSRPAGGQQQRQQQQGGAHAGPQPDRHAAAAARPERRPDQAPPAAGPGRSAARERGRRSATAPAPLAAPTGTPSRCSPPAAGDGPLAPSSQRSCSCVPPPLLKHRSGWQAGQRGPPRPRAGPWGGQQRLRGSARHERPRGGRPRTGWPR